MIAGITVKNYKAIKSLKNLSLNRFHVLVGPNASGKSTFLDALQFVKDCLEHGSRKAVEKRAPEFRDLTFMRQGGPIEIELWLDMGNVIDSQQGKILLYRLAVVEDEQLGVRIDDEILKEFLKKWAPAGKDLEFSPKLTPRRLLGKTSKGTDFYRRENGGGIKTALPSALTSRLCPSPPDEERYPTANVVKDFLMQGVQYINVVGFEILQRWRIWPCRSPLERL